MRCQSEMDSLRDREITNPSTMITAVCFVVMRKRKELVPDPWSKSEVARKDHPDSADSVAIAIGGEGEGSAVCHV